MKFLLISAVLAGLQPVYTDESVCKRAAEVINQSYPNEGAVCIPMPEYSVDDIEQERIFNNFFDLAKKLQELGVDKNPK